MLPTYYHYDILRALCYSALIILIFILFGFIMWFLFKHIEKKQTQQNLINAVQALKKTYEVSFTIHADYHTTYTSLDDNTTTLSELISQEFGGKVNPKDVQIKSIVERRK